MLIAQRDARWSRPSREIRLMHRTAGLPGCRHWRRERVFLLGVARL